MPRHRLNYGITAADSALVFELVEATTRAGRPLEQWLSISPSQAMLEPDRCTAYAEVRKRFVQTVHVRHEQPAIAVFFAEKKLHDPKRAGLHFHALSATQRGLSEPLLRSFTGATATRIGQGTWISDNGQINTHIEPNLGHDGIFNRTRYVLKERSEEYEANLIDRGMIDEHWGEVWKLEPPAQIRISRLIITTDAKNLIAADRDRRPKFYLLPSALQIEAAPAEPVMMATAGCDWGSLKVCYTNGDKPDRR